jgi:hypothetical protein
MIPPPDLRGNHHEFFVAIGVRDQQRQWRDQATDVFEIDEVNEVIIFGGA